MRVTLITDASFCGKTGNAGYGYHIKCHKGTKTNGAPIRQRCSSSGEAELHAVWHGVRNARDLGMLRRNDTLLIQIDSTEAIGHLKRAKSDALIRDDLTHIVSKIVSTLEGMKVSYKIKHVKAHTDGSSARGRAHNSCDAIAKYHMRLQRNRKEGEICIAAKQNER